jgi:hypothetical protein
MAVYDPAELHNPSTNIGLFHHNELSVSEIVVGVKEGM